MESYVGGTWVREYDLDIIKDTFEPESKWKWEKSRRTKFLSDIDNLLSRDYSEMCRELGSPIVYIKNRDILKLNICLKDIEFNKVVDSYTCYQEIYMFVDNNLRSKPETIDISDENKAASKGYHEMSFKNRGKVPKRRKHRK